MGATKLQFWDDKLPPFGQNGHHYVNSCLSDASVSSQQTFLSQLLRVLALPNLYSGLRGYTWPNSQSLYENTGTKKEF